MNTLEKKFAKKSNKKTTKKLKTNNIEKNGELLLSDDLYIDFGERGRYSKRNKLNDLTGKEWIKFTKSWFVHRPKNRNKLEILHPAKFPESLIEEFIGFFTKKGAWVLDPFAGTGSTAIAAKSLGRNCLGIEITKKYSDLANKRIENNLELAFHRKTINKVIQGNSFNADNLIKKNFPKLYKTGFDLCVTSPPYWNQLKRNTLRQLKRSKDGLDTKYSEESKDIGNEDDYFKFIEKQKEIFNCVYRLLKDKAYLVVITNNVFFNGRLYPLAYDTFTSLTRGNCSWVGKDEKIWCQDDKGLAVLGINNAWVGNRHHQYCLIFRKEKKS